MSKPQYERVVGRHGKKEQGIYKTTLKNTRVRYQVRVAPETNSRKEIKRTCDSLDEAQRLVREAARIRKEGKNVKDVWDAEVDRHGKRRVRVPIDTFFEEYVADCDRRLDIGSKKSPSKGGSGTGLRDSSVKGYKSKCRTLARYLENLSVNYLDELTEEKFEKLRDAMVVDGLSETTQGDLLGHLTVMINARKRNEFPSGFPDDHDKIKAVQPANPLAKQDDPDKWGGTEMDKFPALPLLDAFRLAEALAPPRRLGVYLAVLMGLRPGEILGLQLDVISYKGNRVWLNIKRTKGPGKASENEQGWVKTDDSYRKLPVPAVLQDALVGYCTEFHDWDPLSGSKPQSPNAWLLQGLRREAESHSAFTKALNKALKRTGLTRKNLGGKVTLQHLRRTCLSYIQNAMELTSWMLEEVNPDEDSPDGLKDYGTTERRFTRLGMRVSPKSASRYAGHKEQGESSDREASPVTRVHYNRRVLKGDPNCDVADWISLIVKLEKRDELIAAGEELDWSIPVAKKETLLTDGDEGWVSYVRFAAENGLPLRQVEGQINGGWLSTALRAEKKGRGFVVPRRKVLPLTPKKPESKGSELRTAVQLEHLEMLRTFMATVSFIGLANRLGFRLKYGPGIETSEHIRARALSKHMIEQGLLVPAEDPYSQPFVRFQKEEADRVYQALVVKPFLEQLRRGGAQPAATLGNELKAELIFRTRTGDGKRHRAKRREQAERCLKGLEADGLVEELRNGSWKLTPQDDTHPEADSNE